MIRSRRWRFALAALVLLPGLLTVTTPAVAGPQGGHPPGRVTLGLGGWQVQSSALATAPGTQVSTPDFRPAGWLPVRPDDAGAPGTEITALVQNGQCPDVFRGDAMRRCFGYLDQRGPLTTGRFAVPWWFRTDFTPAMRPGQHASLVVPGVVGEAEIWVNGTMVAGRDLVSGAYARHSFDLGGLLRPGRKNSLAVKMYPNDPDTTFALDHLDWGQLPPDNNTGIQFPISLQVSDALAGTNAHVRQATSPDLSSSALTVYTDVTNRSGAPRRAQVGATITPPGGGAPITVRREVTVPAGQTSTVTFTPAEYPELRIAHPKLWWPYSMGGQPLYTVDTTVAERGRVSTTESDTFGIRTVTSRLVGKSPQAPEGSRIFAVNGREFVFRSGGYDPDLFLRYSSADTAHQIELIRNLGLNGIRVEGHDMPQDFYRQLDRAGILVMAGFQCCDAWQPEAGTKLTERDYRIIHDSAVGIAVAERNHPSVFTYGWSDNEPTPRQEAESLRGFSEAHFDVPIIASAEYKKTPILGQAGMKEGPYDWVPPAYWYDSTHYDPADPSRTNVGGAWGFASEQSAGHTVPTMDSIRRFLSPQEQEKLWREPDYNQYHANFKGGHGGYRFGTLYNFDTALAKRYGQWDSLDSYVRQAQVANYENTRSQFESFLAHSTDPVNPSTGLVYWQLNKGWPTLLWSLYNYDGDQPGAYFGAQKANRPLHALYTYDDDSVALSNLTGSAQDGLSVRATVHGADGAVLDDQTSPEFTVDGQRVRPGVLRPKVPAVTTPPAAARVYFVELRVLRHGKEVDRNVYWRSTQQDVVDWPATYGNPQASMTQYADLDGLRSLAPATVSASARTRHEPGRDDTDRVTTVTVTNTSSARPVAFFLRADLRRGTANGRPAPGDNQVRGATWSDNELVLWPGQSQTISTRYRAADLGGAPPVVTVSGWNTGTVTARG